MSMATLFRGRRPSPRPTPTPLWVAFGLLVASSSARPGRAGEPPSALTVVERSVAQDQGGWLVEYRLRYHGPSAVVAPSDIAAKLEGWVSNSRVGAHAVPRPSAVSLAGSSGLSGVAEVVASSDDACRCRERVVAHVWADEPTPDVVEPAAARALAAAPGAAGPKAAPAPAPAPLGLAPGATVRVRLKIEHLHFLYGDYDPLLGVRTLELNLGAAALRDDLPLDREHYLAQAKATWPVPPEDRRDPRHFVTGPDSLHLEAHVPGNQYYRFPERPVRYGTKMRLTYWYYIARGTEGECKARVAQYKDTPTAWKVLSDGAHEECLERVGRWVKVERVFRTEDDATTLALDFRITSGTDVGEMWVDDVTLEPVRNGGPTGP